ncbi:MAG: right-handed parallel beta-helix repeat-containing protein [bacterium]
MIRQPWIQSIRYILMGAAVFVLAPQTWATDYYVDAVQGNDAGGGTSVNAPWKSIAKVNSRSFNPGDQILFKRGGVWKEMLVAPSSGSASNPVTLGAYGSGDKPVITAVDAIPGGKTAGTWTNLSGNVWYMSLAADPLRVFLNGQEYGRAQTPSAPNATLRYGYDSAAKRLYLYATANPASAYATLEHAAARTHALRTNQKNYLVIRDLDLRGGGVASLEFAESNFITVDGCDIGWNSGKFGILAHGYGASKVSLNGVIRNCLLDSGSRLRSPYHISPEIPHDGIKLRYGCQNWEIHHNTLRDWGHTGIYVTGDAGYQTKNNKVYSNYLTAPDIDYGRGLSIDGPDGTCFNNEMFFNSVIDTTCRNQINGDHNLFYYNIIAGMTNVAYAANGTAQGISSEGYTGWASHHNQFFNNLILNCDEAGIKVWGFTGATDKYANEYRNNIVYNCGRNSKDNYKNFGIVIENHTTVKNNIYTNNLVFQPAGITNVVNYRGTAMSVPTFNSQNGKNGDTAAGNLFGDPLFTDLAGGDYTLQANSPAIDAGIPVGLNQGLGGVSVPYGLTVDIGPYEYVPVPLPPIVERIVPN